MRSVFYKRTQHTQVNKNNKNDKNNKKTYIIANDSDTMFSPSNSPRSTQGDVNPFAMLASTKSNNSVGVFETLHEEKETKSEKKSKDKTRETTEKEKQPEFPCFVIFFLCVI